MWGDGTHGAECVLCAWTQGFSDVTWWNTEALSIHDVLNSEFVFDHWVSRKLSVFPQPPHSAVWCGVVWCGVGMGCNQSKELGLGVTPYTDTAISPLSIHSNIYPLFLFNKYPLRKTSRESQDLSGAPGSQHGNQKAHALRSWIEGYGSELSAKTQGERPK